MTDMLQEMFIYMLIDKVASGINPGAALDTVAQYLIGSAENDMDKKVDKLIRAPYLNAIDNLKGAQNAATEASRCAHVEEARRNFITAKNQDSPVYSLKAAFYTGVCYDMTLEPENAKRWYQTCFETFFEVEDQVVRRFLEVEEDDSDGANWKASFQKGGWFDKVKTGLAGLSGARNEKFEEMQFVLRELYDSFDDLTEIYIAKEILTKDRLKSVRLANRAVDRLRIDSLPPLKKIRPILLEGRPHGRKEIIGILEKLN